VVMPRRLSTPCSQVNRIRGVTRQPSVPPSTAPDYRPAHDHGIAVAPGCDARPEVEIERVVVGREGGHPAGCQGGQDAQQAGEQDRPPRAGRPPPNTPGCVGRDNRAPRRARGCCVVAGNGRSVGYAGYEPAGVGGRAAMGRDWSAWPGRVGGLGGAPTRLATAVPRWLALFSVEGWASCGL